MISLVTPVSDSLEKISDGIVEARHIVVIKNFLQQVFQPRNPSRLLENAAPHDKRFLGLLDLPLGDSNALGNRNRGHQVLIGIRQ